MATENTENTEKSMLIDPEVTDRVIGCALEVHSRLGPGLLETLYESALCIEFAIEGCIQSVRWLYPCCIAAKRWGRFVPI